MDHTAVDILWPIADYCKMHHFHSWTTTDHPASANCHVEAETNSRHFTDANLKLIFVCIFIQISLSVVPRGAIRVL